MGYTSSYSGSEIDGVIALLNGKGLGNVTGFIKRKSDGTFEEGNPATGSVTSVAVSNATNGGLSVSGSPITSSGTISIGHSNVLTSAQTTQALYPIKIDKNGHISAYGSAVTSLPASDVSAWAKASTKPSYTANEVGAATSDHTHTTSLATDTGTSSITLASAGKYKLTAGGTSVVFTMPTIPTVSYPVTSVNSKTGAVSLTASDVGAASSSHTHDITLATDTGTSAITLAHGGKYKLTAGGSSIIFTLPSDNNTNYYHTSGSWSGLKYTATANGGAGELSFTIPTGTSATTVALGNHTHSDYLTSSSTLDATKLSGTVPTASLPSFVDDVLEYSSQSSFPSTGETGKIYVATDTNLTYRWSGSAYVEISPSLALGETSSTAYRGDRGKIAYDHSQATHARTDATAVSASSTNGNIKINGTETTVYTHPGSGTNPHGTTYSDVGAAASGHTHDISLATSTGTSTVTLASAGKYALTAGGKSVIFTMPTIPTVSYPVTSVNSKTGAVSLTYSDVGAASSSHTHTASEVGAATSGHTHTTTLATDTGTSSITLASAGKYKLTAGGTSVIFTMPTIPTVSYPVTSVNSKTGAVSLTYSDVGAAASSHTHDYVPTTRTVNSKALSADISLTASDVGAASSSHTHDLSIASGGSSPTALSANTTYTLTAGGKTLVFTTPAGGSTTVVDSNPTLAWSTTSTVGTVGGTALRVTMPAKPSYTYSDVGAASSGHTHTTSIATSSATNQLTLAANTKYAITAGGTSYVFTTPPDTNTWNANTATVAGYVASPASTAGVTWKTNSSGTPNWQNEYYFQLSTSDSLYTAISNAGWVSDCIV